VRDGRWRSLFIASPRSFMVLLYRRLYGLRARGGWCLWSWRGRPALGGPPSLNNFLSRGRGGALDTLKGKAVIRSRPVWEGGVSVGQHICVEVKSDRRTAPVMTFSRRELKRGCGPRRGYAWGRGDGGLGCTVGARPDRGRMPQRTPEGYAI
jgi:hypothetical protein